MRAVDLIIRKRDGERLTRGEIDWFVDGLTAGRLPDYQASALLMAIVFRGLDEEETGWLTDAMVRSGSRMDLSGLPGIKVGKHSTGGVGDKTSLVVVPLVACCGAVAPKSSGRALGHTGGTIDKLESIPGFRTALSAREFEESLRALGCAFTGQTAEVAPADKTLYALRDVTGTIESVPLIASSIMSKKIAEGTDALVLDVKVGGGAFMKDAGQARALAERMVAIGARVGLRTSAVLTRMDAPLGRAVGNALEVVECFETLKGRGPADLTELCFVLAARMVYLAKRAASPEAARAMVEQALSSGSALERLRQVIERQGGDAAVVDDYDRLPTAARREAVRAPRSGVVTGLDAARIGRVSMALGAGRDRVEAVIDHGAGILLHVKPGDAVNAGDLLAELRVGGTARLDDARAVMAEAFTIADAGTDPGPLVLDTVG